MKELHFKEIDSTNLYLKNNYSSLDNLTFVSADFQTKGKGRNQRVWQSNAGENLLFSLLIKDPAYFSSYRVLSLLSAYSIVEILEDYGIENLSIKWPNDVYVNSKKICGILLEAVSKLQIKCLIIGIGLNVNQKEFSDDYLHPPVSVYQILKEEIPIEEIKKKCYQKLIENLELLKDGKDFYQEIASYDYLKDMFVTYNKKRYQVSGINPDYSLRLVCSDQIIDVESGEISFHQETGEK